MNSWLVLIIFLSTTAGLLIGYLALAMLFYPIEPKKILGIRFHGVLPSRLSEITHGIIDIVLEHLDSKKELGEKFINNASFETLLPEIEIHIDDFLRHRLAKKMPMIGMFIGENTIRQLKEIFMDELKEIFPSVMSNYLKSVEEQIDLKTVILRKINTIPVSSWKPVLYPVISKNIRFISIICGVIGLVVGIIQALIVVFVYKTG